MIRLLTLSLLAATALAATGCGSSSSTQGQGGTVEGLAQAGAVASEFPKASSTSLDELKQKNQDSLILAPSVSVLEPGTNRYGFALFDSAQKQIAGAPAAVYFANKNGSKLRGPYPARSESLAVSPQYSSKTSSQDSGAAKSVYVANVPFPKSGNYQVLALVKLDGRVVLASPFEAQVGVEGGPPKVGEVAPKVHTPTLASVAGDAARISTRSPAATGLLTDDLFDVYGKKPVALLFATPALCQSRVCGPVVDVLEEARATDKSGKTAYITNEIYKENRADRGLREQPAAYRLPTEPWLFVLDANGKVVERIEGAFSLSEVRRAVAKAGGA
ncbi:MAG: hypothetical protein F2813_05345 [Actinobacteria bacterium]|uniref:Unannotated protein n=1 Tax=freshwater metagenome TaxID=449393 RepID=A0A6J6A0Q8_9ZZZZ|nr:hypothetical protein [Actinomycetota bacterium]